MQVMEDQQGNSLVQYDADPCINLNLNLNLNSQPDILFFAQTMWTYFIEKEMCVCVYI